MSTDTSAKGVVAALFAPFLMALGFILWDKTWNKYRGSAFGLNLFKCTFASIGFFILCLSLGWTSNYSSSSMTTINESSVFTSQNIGFLILSATIGIIIGDLAWLEALRLMGATRVLIVDTIKPFAAAFLGRIILHEKVNSIAYLGIVFTVLGVLIVGLDKELESRQEHSMEQQKVEIQVPNAEDEPAMDHPLASNDGNCLDVENTVHQRLEVSNEKISVHAAIDISMDRVTRGYVYALLNVLLDTFGALLTKQHGQNMATWAINFIRFGSSGLMMIFISMAMRVRNRYQQQKVRSSETKMEYPPLTIHEPNPTLNTTPWYVLPSMPYHAWGIICLGVILVTFLSALLSNYALFQIALALAITLGSITPLYALILEWPLKGIRPTVKATLGSMIAVGGVCILAIWGS